MAKAATTPAPQPTESTTTVSGFSVQLTGFIPLPKGDLRAQADMTALMADIESGDKPFSALFDYIKQREFRVQAINKRFPVSEAMAMLSPSKGDGTEPEQEPEQTEDDGGPEED